jgi:hypothetical protein
MEIRSNGLGKGIMGKQVVGIMGSYRKGGAIV